MTKEEALIKIKEYIGRDKKIANNAKFEHVLFDITSFINNCEDIKIFEKNDSLYITSDSLVKNKNITSSNDKMGSVLSVNDGIVTCESIIGFIVEDGTYTMNRHSYRIQADDSVYLTEYMQISHSSYEVESMKEIGTLNTIRNNVYDNYGERIHSNEFSYSPTKEFNKTI